MGKLNRDFFIDNEVFFVGFSSRQESFCNSVYQAFSNSGIRVIPLNKNRNLKFDIKVYNDTGDLQNLPKTVYFLTNQKNTGEMVKELKNRGVKRILFNSKKSVSPATLKECSEAGIQTVVACPMMLLGGGFHRLHGFFAGI